LDPESRALTGFFAVRRPLDKRVTFIINQVHHTVDESQITYGGSSDIPADVIHGRQRRLTHRKLMQHFQISVTLNRILLL